MDIENKVYRLSRYRYVNVIIFMLVTMVNTLAIQTFLSINSLIHNRYNYPTQLVTLCSMLGPIAHPFMATICNWILDKFGIKIGCSIGGLLVIAGAWVRLMMKVNQPTWAIIGAVLAGIGNLFVLSSPSAFAIKWFNTQTVPQVISILVLLNILSGGIGSSIAGIFLPQTSTVQQIQHFLLIQAIIITIPFILFFILFRQRPQHPPSRAASNTHLDHHKQPYIKTIKALIKNKQYLKIIISMSLSYGISLSYISLLNQSLATLGYKQPGKTTSILLLSAFLTGIISTPFLARSIRISLEYKKIISICLLSCFINFGFIQIICYMGITTIYIFVIIGVTTGFFLIPITALFTMYAAEQTYPTAQGSTVGYLFAGSQTVGFISSMIWVLILDIENKWKIYMMFAVHVGLIGVSLIVNLNIKQILNKTNYQLGKNIDIEQDENENEIKDGSKYENSESLLTRNKQK